MGTFASIKEFSFSVLSNLPKLLPAILTSVAALLVAGFVIDRTWPQAGDWLFGRWETGGLIFVESPEVYTRQRLVNDRYQQDAWLRRKLEEIDTSALIVRTENSDFSGRIAIGAGAGDESDGEESDGAAETRPFALLQSGEIPFGPRFSLQASQRDRIRQRILENALDDRHDLSGNTVIGLKFDTAIIPGRSTNRTPIVVVKVRDNLVDRLRGRASEVAPYYAFSSFFVPFKPAGTAPSANEGQAVDAEACEEVGPEADGTVCDIKAVNQMNDYFAQWSGNLERRLNDELERQLANERERRSNTRDSDARACEALPARSPKVIELLGELTECSGGHGSRSCSGDYAGSLVDWLREVPICTGADGETVNRDLLDALSPMLFPEISHLSRTIETELRVVPRRDNMGEFKKFLAWSAQKYCRRDKQNQDGEQSSLFGLFDALSREPHGTTLLELPGPLNAMFQVQFGLRPASDAYCGFQIEARLIPRQMSIMIPENHPSSQEVREALTGAGYTETECYASQCNNATESSVEVWFAGVRVLQDRDKETLFDQETLESLISATEASVGDRENRPTKVEGSCRHDGDGPGPDQGTKLQFGKHAQLGEWLFMGDGAFAPTQESDDTAWQDLRCVDGRVVQLRAGAFLFMRRMASVESYTYAAFPRGDVSGVVTEASSASDIGIARPMGGASSGSIETELSSKSSSNAVEARPTIVNFATGDREADFDFGWAIVKDGQMEPMLASQVVLVSVPAYSEEIVLEVWRGFIDVDYRLNHETNEGVAPPANFVASQTIREFIQNEEQGVIMRLRVPADYTALDGMIIGHDILSGPHIDKIGAAEETCHFVFEDRDLSIEIAGDRLWRSTVVTVDGVKADRIEVMPDMGGILAVFEAKVAPSMPGDQANPRNALYGTFETLGVKKERTLTVWTSEGNDTGKVKLCSGFPEVPSRMPAPPNTAADGATSEEEPEPSSRSQEPESEDDDAPSEAGKDGAEDSAEARDARRAD